MIALVGIGLRFPECKSVPEFWDLLLQGRILSARAQREGMPTLPAPAHLLDRVDLFDSNFFKVSASEALALDPQQRLLLEISYEALQNAGLKKSDVKGKNVGVFVGVSNVDYQSLQWQSQKSPDMFSLTGMSPSLCANRISYFYDLKGPSIAIDTACSSSLTALHLARQSLLSGESEMALVGGVNLILTSLVSEGYNEARATSATAQCRAFDADANGVVRGEGAAMVVLMPLERAEALGLSIYAILEGTSVSQDGLTQGLTAPSPQGQRKALELAWKETSFDPSKIDFVETHGTGTLLGDPIEAKALSEAFGRNREEVLRIGSVKTNLGHLEAAAGMAGLIKTALCLKNKTWVRSLHFSKPNPHIPFEKYKLKVQTENETFAKDLILAGVSSFGFGGTNAHAALRSYSPTQNPIQKKNPFFYFPLPVSAESVRSLEARSKNLESLIKNRHEVEALSRSQIRICEPAGYRKVLVAGPENQIEILSPPQPQTRQTRSPKIAFIFSGMGSQYSGMGQALWPFTAFQKAIQNCDQAFRDLINWNIADFIEKGLTFDEKKSPQISQVLIFSIQYAMSELLKSFGILPNAVLGSSLGELAAAVTAGRLDLDSAARILLHRLKLLESQIGVGELVIVAADHDLVESLAPESVWAIAHNSPQQTVVTGLRESLSVFLSRLDEKKIAYKKVLGGAAPSHSPLIKPLEKVFYDFPQLDPKTVTTSARFYSTVEGETENKDQELDLNYWWKNLSQKILLKETLQKVDRELSPLYIEIGPHPLSLNLIYQTLHSETRNPIALAPLKRNSQNEKDLVSTLAQLDACGVNVDYSPLFPNDVGLISEDLPNYCWDWTSYWPRSLSEVLPEPNLNLDSGPSEGSKLSQLQKLSTENRRTFLLEFLKSEVARALNVKPETLDTSSPLAQVGVGSLMGIELSNRLKREFKIELPLAFLLKGPSLLEIAEEILKSSRNSNVIPVSHEKIRNASFAQERFYFLRQWLVKPSTYHIPLLLNLKGTFDVEKFLRSLKELIQRHNILRAIELEGWPLRYQIMDDLEPEVVVETGPFEGDKNAFLKAWAEKPFDFQKKAPFRIYVRLESADATTLFWVIHHSLVDGWGLKVLVEDLERLYRGDELAPLPYQYFDFADWARLQIETSIGQQGLEYWQTRLRDAPPVTTFQKSPNAQKEKQGERKVFFWNSESLSPLKALAQKQKTTLFSSLSAAVAVLLNRQTGQDDLLIATPVLGRTEPGSDSLLGCFLNMLPLRYRVSEQTSFGELLETSNDQTANLLQHQLFPLEKVPGLSKVNFNIAVAFHAAVNVKSWAGLEVETRDFDLGTSKFDVSFSFMEKDQGLEIIVEWDQSLFTKDRIDSWVLALEGILMGGFKNPQSLVMDLPVEPDEYFQKRLERNHQEQKAIAKLMTPRNVPELLTQLTRENPDSLAVIDGVENWTWSQLDRLSESLKLEFQNSGVRDGVTVAIQKHSRLQIIAAQWALWKLRAHAVIFDADLPKGLSEKLISSSGAQWAWSDRLEFLSDQPSRGSHIAYVVMTSGSTGQPKAIAIPHSQFAFLIDWHAKAYGVDQNSRSSSFAGPAFDAFQWETWGALANGSPLHIPDPAVRESLSKTHAWIAASKITHVFLPTPLFEILDSTNWTTSSLKYVLVGGDRLMRWTPNHWPCPVVNHYGPSETTVVATAGVVNDNYDIGATLPYAHVSVCDPKQRELPPYFIGELKISGRGSMTEYLTGDWAYQDEYGRFYFIGRKDTQVKIRGHRIELGEIETTLLQVSGLQKIVVLWSAQEQKLKAFYQSTLTQEQIRKRAKEKLPAIKIPDVWVAVDEFPLTQNGKIDRVALMKISAKPLNESQDRTSLDDLESKLMEIFSKALKVDVGPETDFFEAGGHSLLALQLKDEIESNWKVTIPLKNFFANPCVRAVAEWIRTEKTQIRFPLTDLQEAYWIGRRSDVSGGGVSSQIYFETQISNLDLNRFHLALESLVQRHSMLRARIQDGQWLILNHLAQPYFEVRDLRTVNDSKSVLESLRQELSHKKFNPEVENLWSISLSRLGSDTFIWHFNIDGLIADAKSLQILMKDFWRLYQGETLAPVEAEFQHAVTEIKSGEASAAFKLAENYWRNRIPQLPIGVNLPISTSSKEPRFNRISGTLSAPEWSAVKAHCQRLKVSPTVFLASAFASVLQKMTADPKLSILLTLFNRPYKKFNFSGTVGDFTSVLPLSFEESLPLRYLKQTQDQLLDHLDHSAFSGVKILREIQKQSKEPVLFPVVLTSFLGEDFNPQETPWGPVLFSRTQTPQVYLDHQVSEFEGKLFFQWDYREDLLRPLLIEELFKTFTLCLKNPELEVPENSWQPEAPEKPRAQISSTQTLLSLFTKNLQNRPETIALLTESRNYTYSEIWKRVQDLRARLKTLDVQSQDRIGVLLPSGFEQVVAVLAILAEGACFVPATPDIPSERLASMSAKANVRFWIEPRHFENLVETANESPLPEIKSDHLAYIIFTSGSTGTPKGVMISHGAVLSTLLELQEILKLKSSDRTLQLSKLSFDLAIFDLFGIWNAGGAVAVSADSREFSKFENLLRFAERSRVTIWNSVPTTFHSFVESGFLKSRLASLRYVLLSGDWISVGHIKDAQQVRPEIQYFSLGGATEASIWSNYHRIENLSREMPSIPYGRPLPRQNLVVLNSLGETTLPYVPGDLFISGEALATGYVSDELLTSESFFEINGIRHYKTGDRAQYTENSVIEFLGRKDSQVKIQGYRIEISEIEAVFKQIGAEAVVIAAGNPRSEKILKVFYRSDKSQLHLIDQLKSKLPVWMIPSEWVQVSEFPLNENGKIDRRRLAEENVARPDHSESFSLKDKNLQEQIKSLVERTLNHPNLEVDQDLLSTGINSVDLVRISQNLQESFGRAPGLGEIFQLRTIQDLARYYVESDSAPRAATQEIQLITDFKLREEFIAQKPGIKQITNPQASWKLPIRSTETRSLELKSSRQFVSRPASLQELTGILQPLLLGEQDGKLKGHYPSAGSLYPVRIYLYLKPNSVVGLRGGFYYFNQATGELIQISEQEIKAEELHLKLNQTMHASSAVTLILVGALGAIEPLYSDRSKEFCLIEAGTITQILRTQAATANWGLCSIGQINWEKVARLMNSETSEVFLHALEMGPLFDHAFEEFTL